MATRKRPDRYAIFYADGKAMLASFYSFRACAARWHSLQTPADRGFFCCSLNAAPARVTGTWVYAPAYRINNPL